MKVLCMSCYLTKVEHEDGTPIEWTQNDYHASKFIKALKGDPIKGYATIPVLGQSKHLEQSNAGDAFSFFGAWAWDVLSKTDAAKNGNQIAIVPVPSSKTTVASTEDFCAHKLCREIERRAGNKVRIADVLRWEAEQMSSRKGGTRNSFWLEEALVVTGPLGAGPFVLIDDVFTTGGHLKAAGRKLRTAGEEPKAALCAGRTAHDSPANAFGPQLEDLSLD